ncbi:MAG: galactosyltransferase-related protein [Luteolibacter sp.]
MFPHQKRSPNFAPCLLSDDRDYGSRDITAVISIRAHENNPWVLERLEILAAHFDPAPVFLIVDFGSAPEYAEQIHRICQRDGLTYLHLPDAGIFSLSIARNEGANAARTDLLYFTDIDFFSGPGHYGDLARHANDHDFRSIRDIVLNLPAYHLNEESTRGFSAARPAERHKLLQQLGVMATESASPPVAEFIAPYSNNFLCTRDFFQIVGGYDSRFRGHGSEDFELMIRMAFYTRHVHLPDQLDSDIHKPASATFLGPRPYAGFRRLCEAVSFRGESAGFKAFHLWHPCPPEDPWRNANDWSRSIFREAVSQYLKSPENLAGIDHIPRQKTALCVCKDKEHYGYFLPFRALGYKLELISGEAVETIEAARKSLADGRVDLFMIFNPYMKSHSTFHGLFEFARECGVEVVVVERGALPSTVYYAADVSYNDPDFLNYHDLSPQPDAKALAAADETCSKIRSGGWTLENLTDYEQTQQTHSRLATGRGTRVFIPLQLADDMAVTRFVAPTQSYLDFEGAICETALAHPEMVFVVKAHPLNRDSFTGGPPNLVVCENEENVHAVIDACDATVCYNSGVGLLSLIHGKPTVTIGNAYYNMEGMGFRAKNLAEAVGMLADGACSSPSADCVRRFIAWLITCKYSFFKAEDDIREFTHRNSHGYKDIMITHLNWNGVSLPLGRISALGVIGRKSYINGRLGLSIGTDVGCFDNPKPIVRGPIKSFLIRRIKKPMRRFFSSLKTQ